MEFIIDDIDYCNNPPHPKAVEKLVLIRDRREYPETHFNEFVSKGKGDRWRDRGKNHREHVLSNSYSANWKNGITRDIESKEWVIEINTVADFAELISKYLPFSLDEGDGVDFRTLTINDW